MSRKLAKSTVSQRRVVDAAARIFREHGYSGTTMRAVADEADLKAGSIYYHYKSKDELISAVLDTGIQDVTQRVQEALAALPDTASGRQRIEAAVRAHLHAIIEVGDYTLATRSVFGQVPEEIRDRNMAQRNAYGAIWQDLIASAHASGEFRTGANLTMARLFVLGALNWTIEWFKPGNRSIEEVARDFTSLVLDGLAGGKPDAAAAPASKTPAAV